MTLEIKNVSFSYAKEKQVLSDVSFSLKEGECVALLGQNGVGKSTLLSLILGFNKLKQGEIYFDDIEVNKMTPSQRADYISYVPQLIEGNELTVRDTVLLGRLPFYKIYPTKKDHELTDEYIKKFNLEDIKDKETKFISGGERQKTNIARGFIQDSKIVIFDEPTSNLDIKSQVEVMNLIKREKQNKSFIISMHDLNQAYSIADKFVFLVDGRVKQICTKEDINTTLLKEVYGLDIEIKEIDGRKVFLYEN